MPLNQDEGRNSDAREILQCSERRIVGLIEEDKITARRNTALGREGQWIINLRSVEEYKVVSCRECAPPRPRGHHPELSDYLNKQMFANLLRAGISVIDGRETGLAQAWVMYKGPTGRRCLTRFKRGQACPSTEFLIEVADDGVKVHYKLAQDESLRTIKSRLLAVAQRALAAAKRDSRRHRRRQAKEAQSQQI
jgi:hypothetical protein